MDTPTKTAPTPTLADIVAAFRAHEAGRIAAEQAAQQARRQAETDRRNACIRAFEQLLEPFAPAFAELESTDTRWDHYLERRRSHQDPEAYWINARAHRPQRQLTLSVTMDADGIEFTAWPGPPQLEHTPWTDLPPAIRTRDAMEMSLWLAEWLGRRLARSTH